MRSYLLAYPLTLILLAGIDFLWLSRMADAVYRPTMGDMAAAQFRAAPAVAFYLIYAAGVVYFAVAPGLAGGGIMAAVRNGAIFGLCAYATYDLTNQATLKNWSTTLTVIDMGWGMVLTAVSAAIACLAVSAIFGRVES